jgi:hypothetical protein
MLRSIASFAVNEPNRFVRPWISSRILAPSFRGRH